MEKVLLIGDPAEAARLAQPLAASGFQIETGPAGEAGIQSVLTNEYAALLLATGLAGPSAFDLLRLLRATSRMPVLLLVEAEQEADGILGLELGADDYLINPVNQRVLLARLRALLRRVQHVPASPLPAPRIIGGNLEADVQRRCAWRAGKLLQLTAIEFDLLHALLQAPGQLLLRETLVQSVFGRAYHPEDRSLDVHISKLRKKLAHAGCIQAVRGSGYVLTLEASSITVSTER